MMKRSLLLHELLPVRLDGVEFELRPENSFRPSVFWIGFRA
jgi:hypothetical protein